MLLVIQIMFMQIRGYYEDFKSRDKSNGKCDNVWCKDCPITEYLCQGQFRSTEGYRTKIASVLLSIAEVSFEPYSVDVWLDTDRPFPNRDKDTKLMTLNTRLFGDRGDAEETDYDFIGSQQCSHKFKLTLEKAED